MAECNACLYNPVCELWRSAERQDALSHLTGGLADCPIYKPAADLVEVRHGEWLSAYQHAVKYGIDDEQVLARLKKDNIFKFCPYCDQSVKGYHNYCPNCGAKMDGKGDCE